MAFKRDMEDLGRPRSFHDDKGRRPVWKGPIPDRYYYAVKNKPHKRMAAWIVLFTDDPQYEGKVRQISSVKGGSWSLLESDVPLPTGQSCRLLKHSLVDNKKDKLIKSHDRAGEYDPETKQHPEIPGEPITEEELFG